MAMGRRRQGAAAGVVRGEQRDSRAGPEPLRRVRGRNIVGDGRASPRPCPRAGGDSKRILIQAAAFNLREILRGDTDQWIRRSDQEIAASGWPSLAVSKAEFGDEWPFRDDRVTVECRDGLFCIVNIGGYDFALNGAARSRFGLPFAHDAGVAVLGKSVGPFIEMAHGLSA